VKNSTAELRLSSRLDEIAFKETGERDVVPARWLETPTWRCSNMHVSSSCIEDRRGQRRCMFRRCGLPVLLTFPGDRSGPLSVPSEVRTEDKLPRQPQPTRRRPFGLYPATDGHG